MNLETNDQEYFTPTTNRCSIARNVRGGNRNMIPSAYLVLVEVGGLRDESGVRVAGAGPQGRHPIQQGTNLE